MQFVGFMRTSGDNHFDILIELGKNHHHPIYGEAAELRVADAGKVGRGNASNFFRYPDCQFLVVPISTCGVLILVFDFFLKEWITHSSVPDLHSVNHPEGVAAMLS
jgi:hypothetical protein